MGNGIMLGNKLFELRKQNRLSQEELAEKLGVSRQAVSKWECGESLPDTDNLISISKLYGVSLDALVGNTPSEANTNASASERKAPIEEELDEMDEDEAEEQEEEQYYSYDGTPADKKRKVLRVLYALPYPIIITIAFLLWGFLADGWGVAWTLYITIPIFYTLLDAIRVKRFSTFCYPVLVAFVYCLLGMAWDLWHPHWIMFITIPVYYMIAGAIDENKNK